MQWKTRRLGAKQRAQKRWHKYFAWFPVKVGKSGKRPTWVWLEYVKRKGCFLGHYVFNILSEWKYDFLEDGRK